MVIHKPFRKLLAPLALGFGVTVTALICLLVSQFQQEQSQTEFNNDSKSVTARTKTLLHAHFEVLLGVKGLFSATDRVGRNQFQQFLEQLQLDRNHPGFQAIQFVRYVPDAELDAFVNAVRLETSGEPHGSPQFTVRPDFRRQNHYVIQYTEPLKGNEAALGLDLASLPSHLKALELGRDTGDWVATEKVKLVQDPAGKPAFVMRVPIFRRGAPIASKEQRHSALLGFGAMVYRVDDLMREIVDPDLLPHLHIRIFDTGYVSEPVLNSRTLSNLMFDSRGNYSNTIAADPDAPGIFAHHTIEVGQRRWELVFSASKGSRYGRDYSLIAGIASSGLIISGLVFVLLIALSRERGLSRLLNTTGRIAHVGGWEFDVSSKVISVTDEISRIFRVDEAKLAQARRISFATFALRIEEKAQAQLSAVLENAVERGLPFDIELPCLAETGAKLWIRMQGKCEMNQGNTRKVYGAIQEITNFKLALQELAIIFRNVNVGIAFLQNGRIVRVNKAFLDMFGFADSAVIGQSTRIYYPSDDAYEAMAEAYAALASGQHVVTTEVVMRRADGSELLCAHAGSLVDPANPSNGSIWTYQDITSGRAAEKKLSQTLAELETILNNAWIGVFVANGARQIVRMNHYCESVVFQCPTGGYIGQSTRSLFSSDDDYDAFTHKVRSAAMANVSIEYSLSRKDGTLFLAKLVGSLLDPSDPEKGAIWLVTDISKEREKDERMRRTFEDQQMIFDNAAVGIMFATRRKVVRCNQRMADIFGYTPAELLGSSTRIFYESAEEYRNAGIAGYATILAGQPFVHEMKVQHKNGRLIWVRATGRQVPLSKPGEDVVWIFEDVSERKDAQLEQKAAEDKLNRALSELDIIFNYASVGIALFVDRRFVRVNKTYEVMFGWSAAELIGQTARRLFASDEAYAAIDDVYKKLAVGENILRLDLEVRCADGRDILCECVSSYVDPSDPAKGVVWLATDVTDLRHAQTALQNARDDALAQKTLAEQQHILVAQTLKHVATLLNNSGQGFLSFGQDLLIDEGYSRECNRIFGCDVGNLPVPLLLCSTNATQGFLEKTLRLAMDSASDHLRRDAYMCLLPAEYRLGERYYTAQYRLLEDGHMMLILTDVTDERQLKERLKLERLRLEFIVHALENRDDLLEMLGEFEVFRSHTLPGLLSFEQRPRNMLAEILRHIHTFKSLFAQARLPTIPQVLHELENRLGQLRDSTSDADAGAAITTNAIKRHLGITDLGAALESDLALLRQTLGDDFFHSEREVRVPVSKLVSLEEEASALYGADSRMLGLIRYLRYVPVQALIEPHAKAAEQLALRQGKLLAPITFTGATVPVDPTVFGPFCKSLVHLFRNAVDHGIEDADTRLLADKSETASIHCTIHATDDQLTFKISDDGCGIDVARVRAKAIELGKLDALESSALNDADVLMLIFADGVTTRDHISPISGRGVGLSAVQHELEQLGGRAQIESTMGQGSCFTFTLPYHPPVASTTQPSSYEWVKKYLAPLPEVFKVFCDTHLQLAVTINMSYDEYTIDNLFDFTALISLGSGLDVRIGLSIEQPLLLEMTRHFEPGFSESEVKELANSVGAEIANTVVGNASVYFTHLARRVAMGTPDIVFPEHRANTIGLRTFRGFTGQADAGSFMIFCLLSKENTA